MERPAAAPGAWDVVVVGAGPAGSLAARELALAGAAVLVVDRDDFPRDKVCGGCLSARAVGVLRERGLSGRVTAAGAEPLGELELVAAAGKAVLPLPGGAAISRRALDAALLDAAREAGARFRSRSRALLGGLGGEAREVRLPEAGGALAARVVLAADGLSGGLVPGARSRPAISPRSRIGAASRIEDWPGEPEPGRIVMAVTGEGYVGLVRVENGALALAAALDPRVVRERGLAAAARRVLRGAGVARAAELAGGGRWRGTGPLTRRPGTVALARVLAVGDAAGYVEPFTGEGMTWALESALAAVPLALRGVERWSAELEAAWRRRHRSVIARRQRRCQVVAWTLRRPLAVHAAVRLLAVRPSLAAPLVGRLAGAAGGEGAR